MPASSVIPISLRDPFWDDPHFSNHRQEFEDMRREMLREAKEFWSRVDENRLESMFDSHRPVSASASADAGGQTSTSATSTSSSVTPSALESRARAISRQMSNPATTLPRWFMPTSMVTEDHFTGSLGGGTRGSDLLKMKEDEEKFEITLDVQAYRPDELKVTTTADNTVVIEGRHEERGDRGAGSNEMRSSSVQQQFCRQYTLPPSCEPLMVVSNLSRDGVLIVTAPKKRPMLKQQKQECNVPIVPR